MIHLYEVRLRKDHKFLLSLVATGSLTLTVLLAQSPSPPSPTFTAQNFEQYAGSKRHDNRQANQPALNQSPPHYEIGNNQDRQHRDETANETIAKFTIVLAIVGLLQFVAMIAQAVYMHKGWKVTRDAADAARKSADSATQAVKYARETASKTERAVVVIESVVVGNRTSEVSGLDGHNLIIFTLKNFGQTIANSVKLTGKMCGICQWPFPDIPTSNIAPQGKFAWATTKAVGVWLGDDHRHSVNERRAWLEYKITVTYVDVFENPHTYDCEGRYEPALKQFLITSSTSN